MEGPKSPAITEDEHEAIQAMFNEGLDELEQRVTDMVHWRSMETSGHPSHGFPGIDGFSPVRTLQQ
eukprot:6459779-Amphidinium_carterae.1